MESVAALPWNGRQLSDGISGSFRVESVAGLPWNQWQDSRGIGGSFRAEYAGRLLEAIDLNDDGDANDKGELKKIATALPSFLGGDPEDPDLAGASGVAQAADGTYWLVVGGGAATGGGPMPPFSTPWAAS